MDEYMPMKPASKGKVAAMPAASPKDDAATDLLAAIKADDAKAVSLALTRHYEACTEGEDAESAEDEEA